MKKNEIKLIKLILDELDRRIPKTNKEGFLPDKQVLEAIDYFQPLVKSKDKPSPKEFGWQNNDGWGA